MNRHYLREDDYRCGDYQRILRRINEPKRPSKRHTRFGALLIVLATALALFFGSRADAEAVIGSSIAGVKVCRSNSCLKDAAGRELVFACDSIASCDAVAREEIGKYGESVASGTNTWDFRKQYSVTYRRPAPLPSIDCVVSDWSEWSACANSSSSRTRTVTTQPANGGAACPALSESRACTDAWTRCAAEYELCAFTGTRRVRYGAGSTWSTARDIVAINGGVICGNDVFGDPIRGTVKQCELSSVIPSQQPDTVTGSARLIWEYPYALDVACMDGEQISMCEITGFEVMQASTAAGPWSAIATVHPATREYTITNLSAGSHFWHVRALSASARSPGSPIVTKVIR